MPISQEKVTKLIDLDLPSSLSKSDGDEIKKEVGDFILVSVLDYVGDGKSPVSGRAFKQLSKEYAEEEKGGRRLANLELDGDMLRSLTYEVTNSGIEFGIFDSTQAPKAFNHNEGDTLPKRQFIPEDKQKFVGDIEKGIREIVNRRIMEASEGRLEERRRPRSTPSDNRRTNEILEDLREHRLSTQVVNAEPVGFSIFGQTPLDQLVRSILSGESS
jgi:hypothetical protein